MLYKKIMFGSLIIGSLIVVLFISVFKRNDKVEVHFQASKIIENKTSIDSQDLPEKTSILAHTRSYIEVLSSGDIHFIKQCRDELRASLNNARYSKNEQLKIGAMIQELEKYIDIGEEKGLLYLKALLNPTEKELLAKLKHIQKKLISEERAEVVLGIDQYRKLKVFNGSKYSSEMKLFLMELSILVNKKEKN